MNDQNTTALVWLRRDLRLHDHAALAQALQTHDKVCFVFVFDTDILTGLPQADRRVAYIHAAVLALDAQLRAWGGGLHVRHGRSVDLIPQVANDLGVSAVFINRDDEPAAIERDAEVARRLMREGRGWVSCKDHVIFEREEILTQSGHPFTVFTPYRRAWEQKLSPRHWQACACTTLPEQCLQSAVTQPIPTLAQMGFSQVTLACEQQPGQAPVQLAAFAGRIARYAQERDFPALDAGSHLSVHLRFGVLSIRQALALAQEHIATIGAQTWRNELVWRDFYQMILWQRPEVVTRCFKPACERIVWEDAPDSFAAWCAGRSGYPLVDAAMRQLNTTGLMHNRLRMVTASFLSKDLGMDWRRGEAYFARQLLDFDRAANNGGWQWAASTGCDAQPWFRMFNPITQSEKFDPQGVFIRRYLPELANVPDQYIHAPWRMNARAQQACGVHIGRDYPPPIVDHATARRATLARFGRLRPESSGN